MLEEFKLIFEAIKYHNKLEIADSVNGKYIKFCKLIRDADKGDIYYAYANKHVLLNSDDSKINNDVKNIFMEEKSIPHSLIISDNDRVMCLYVLCLI